MENVTFVPLRNQVNLRGRCPHAMQDAALSPRGHLLSCCGFELDGNEVLDLGDTRTTDVWFLIEQANNDGLLAAIAYLGPYFLKGVLERVAPDLLTDRPFGSVCELCCAIVTDSSIVEALNQASEVWLPSLAEAKKIVDSQSVSSSQAAE